jgi:Family of unknown function (DUF6232)
VEEEFAMSTRTYYRGHDAVVTDELFVWRTTPTKGFVVRDLHNVGRVCSQVDRLRPYTAHVTGAALVLVAATLTLLEAPPAYALGVLVVGVPGVFTAAAATRRMRVRRWELHATYRGHAVVLYASHDERVFNQVTRALRRSVEDARPASPKHGMAAA